MFRNIDHLEFYVGNAYVTAYFFTRALGFELFADSGLESGVRDRQSFAVRQGSIRLVFTNPLGPAGPIAAHVQQHGDAIHDIALTVENAAAAFEHCVRFGAVPVSEPRTIRDEHGEIRRAVVRTFGDTVHSLIERQDYAGLLLPGFRATVPGRNLGLLSTPETEGATERGSHLLAIDHIACCVEAGTLPRWMDFYARAFGFEEIHHEDIVTERSAMNSRVIGSQDRTIKLPLMEPAPARGKSQIEEFLDYHHGAGGQHLAFLSDDICASGRALVAGGVDFLQTPRTYYDALPGRIGAIDEDLDDLHELNVLADRDRWGYLLQAFTRPVTGRPTLFLEIVQRKGARGFGGGNVRALFEAVERAQAARGNLR